MSANDLAALRKAADEATGDPARYPRRGIIDRYQSAVVSAYEAGELVSRAPSAPAEVEGLMDALRSYQQADMDGVIVKVSRQACEEAATALTALQAALAAKDAEIARLTGERQTLVAALKDGGDVQRLALARAERAEAALAEREQQVADLLDPTVTCACGYDGPNDVCMKHMPVFKRLTAALEAEKAKGAAQLERAAQVADDEADRILSKQDGKEPEVDMNLRFMALMLPDVAQSIRALTTADAITALEARDKRVREEWPAAALSLYDRFMSGGGITDDERKQVDQIALAAAFGSTAYEAGMDADQGTHAMMRSILLALVDPMNPDLDYLRVDPEAARLARLDQRKEAPQ